MNKATRNALGPVAVRLAFSERVLALAAAILTDEAPKPKRGRPKGSTTKRTRKARKPRTPKPIAESIAKAAAEKPIAPPAPAVPRAAAPAPKPAPAAPALP